MTATREAGGGFLLWIKVEVYAAATIANVVCGFDVLGFALEGPGDRMVIRKSAERGVRIAHHDEFGISADPSENVAGITLLAMLEAANPDFGFEVEITKGIAPGSGIGSSAAGAAVGANRLLGDLYSTNDLIAIAMEGESFASGARHADNIGPAIIGVFTLVRSIDPVEVVSLEYPPLFVTVLHPQIEIKTAHARSILPEQISLAYMIRQNANIGARIAGLANHDYSLISRSLEDRVVQPVRNNLIPLFDDVISAGRKAGALGGGIAGSGPSIFMFSPNEPTAREVCVAMTKEYERTDVRFQTYLSQIGSTGAQVI